MPQRRSRFLALFVLLLFSLSGCRRSPTPQETFDHARQTFIHGDLLGSQTEAAIGYQHFASLNPEWALRFRFLEAESLMWRGMNQQVLRLLDNLPQNIDRESIISN